MTSENGTLYLVGTPIGNMRDITRRAVDVIANVDIIMCEDTRETKKLLSLLDIALGDKKLISVREQNEQGATENLISFMNNGKDVVYMSDAGMPAISDPGARLVDAVHEAGLIVNVIPGPSAVTSAVALSGFNSTAFTFKGFFPRKESEQLIEIEKLNVSSAIMVYFESPNRLQDSLKILAENLNDDQRVVVAREITKKFEEAFRGSAKEAYNHFQTGVKGECVLVIEPSASDSINLEDVAIEKALQLMIDKGLSSKDAIEIVQLLNPISKNQLKEIYNKLKG